MTTMATAEFFIKPEKVEEFLGVLAAALPDTRGFQGCQQVLTYQSQDDPGHIFLYELWDQTSDHQSYLGWRMETGMGEMLEPYASAPPTFAYYDPRPEV